jgi:hypothetical protein
MRAVLACAAVYQFALGAFVLFSPLTLFGWAGIPAPNYLSLWQAAGAISFVSGVGYAIAATDTRRFWPMTLVGLLGKILVPAIFLKAAFGGELPWRTGWALIVDDLIWWLPFGIILHAVWNDFLTEPGRHGPVWQRARTEWGESLGDLSFVSPVLLVALRHSGCTFCREALADLSKVRSRIETSGTRIVLAHMGSPDEGERMAARYALQDLDRVADPNRLLYHALGLRRGSLAQIFGPRVWTRAFSAGVLDGHKVGPIANDALQMGGVFVLDHGRVTAAFWYRHVADRPDFLEIVPGSASVGAAPVRHS